MDEYPKVVHVGGGKFVATSAAHERALCGPAEDAPAVEPPAVYVDQLEAVEEAAAVEGEAAPKVKKSKKK